MYIQQLNTYIIIKEPRHDKTNKMSVRPADSDQPGHPPSLIRVFAVCMKKPWILSYPLSTQWRLWSDWVDPLSTQRRLWSDWADAQADLSRAQWLAKDPWFLHADSEDPDQTGQMPRLIWVFVGRTLILLVLSCRGSKAQLQSCRGYR